MNYTGIGSRETPVEFIKMFKSLAKWLAEEGHVLRSGGAGGADSAFEIGCDVGNGEKEIYLPWYKFNNNVSKFILSPEHDIKAFEIAKKFHPAWDKLSDGGKKLQARNSFQVLGNTLDTPSDFIICWTKGGQGNGGTGQALRIAKAYNIPIFDCGFSSDMVEVRQRLWEFLQKYI